MSKSLHFFLFFCFLFNFIKGNAQCVQVLTTEPLEVCSGGGTTVNLLTEGAFLRVEWTPNFGMDNPNKLNPTFLTPVDTTYLVTFKGLDQETADTCETIAYIEIKTVQFDLILPLDTVELPCGDTIRLPAEVLPSESYFLTEWTTTDGNFVNGNQILTPLIDKIGNYKLNTIGTLGRIVCEATDSLEVIYSNDNQLVLNSHENLHCNQTSVTLAPGNIDTTNSFLYNWTTVNGNFVSPNDQAIVVVDKIGSYVITRTDLFGECMLSEEITVAKIELNSFDLNINQPTCGNPTGTILIENIKGGVGPYNFSIDSGVSFQKNNKFSDIKPGDYTIMVRDTNECELTQAASIIPFPSFQLSLIPNADVENGSTFTLPLKIENQQIEIASIEWQPAFGLSCMDCQNPVITNFRNTQYGVLVFDKNGCEQSATIDITITQPSLYYAPTIFSPNGDGQNDEFAIFLNTKITDGIVELAIFDRYGNLVFRKTTDSKTNTAYWDGKHKDQEMPNGTYLYWGEISLSNGETERINGTINLIR